MTVLIVLGLAFALWQRVGLRFGPGLAGLTSIVVLGLYISGVAIFARAIVRRIQGRSASAALHVVKALLRSGLCPACASELTPDAKRPRTGLTCTNCGARWSRIDSPPRLP